MQIQPSDVLFVINPNAGRALRTRRLMDACRTACERSGRRALLSDARTPQEASAAARQAHESGAAAVFGCGGDGTLTAILQGLPNGSPTALGAVPLGTANVWAYETQLPTRPLAAVSAQLAALDGTQGAALWIDTGRVWSTNLDGSLASQRFLLMASWGNGRGGRGGHRREQPPTADQAAAGRARLLLLRPAGGGRTQGLARCRCAWTAVRRARWRRPC